ncbi:MAG: TolC family protein [Planctomycetia bacterium]|nr:TolC family protein [Planctomycetia bacterium]
MKSLPRPGKTGESGKARRWTPLLLLVLACAVFLPGCTRQFFRKFADRQVDGLLKDKDQYEQWAIEQYHVYPDPRARFADPTKPDRPPMPPDDPAAKALSPNPQRPWLVGVAYIEGNVYLDIIAEWDAKNRAEDSDEDLLKLPVLDLKVGRGEGERQGSTPQTQTGTSADPCTDRPFLIRLEQASELGVFNSREFQTARENLYLAALPVTLQQFAFAPQAFAVETAIRERTGRGTPEGQHNRWRLDGAAGFTQQFATGALLLLQIANQTVIEMGRTASRQTISESVLTFDLMQPFLRGGGFAVTLEALTQAERDLLYQIRNYARFRKLFYVSIAAGVAIGGTNFDVAGGFFSPPAGYLPTLQRKAQLEIERQNISHTQEILRFFRAFSEGGDLSPLQVEQVEQNLLRSRSTVLTREQDYRDSLDRFKLQVGVPTDLPLELDESPLATLVKQLHDYVHTFNQFRKVRLDAADLAAPDNAPQLREALRGLLTDSEFVRRAQRFRGEYARRWIFWERLTLLDRALDFPGYLADLLGLPVEVPQGLVEAELRRLRREQQQLKDLETDLDVQGKTLAPADQQRLDELDFEMEVGRFEGLLSDYEEQFGRAGVYLSEPARAATWTGLLGLPWGAGAWLTAEYEGIRGEFALRLGRLQTTRFRDLLNQLDQVLGAARNERIDAIRNRWPDLPQSTLAGVDLVTADECTALNLVGQTALTNRLDLMNVRAQTVDAWRQIAVSANALLGVLNVAYHLDSFSPLGEAKPLAFGGSRNRHQLVINGELPLVRRAERNAYRAVLIAFQQQRRDQMAAEDRIVREVRSELRQLRVQAENYKIQQRAVELAYSQLENSLETFRAPPAPGAQGGAASAAALTQQLLNALNSLPREQNALVSTWIGYHVTRLQLYRDLELMPLDDRGVWIDEPAANDCRAAPGLFDPEPAAGGERLPEPGPDASERLPQPRVLPTERGP